MRDRMCKVSIESESHLPATRLVTCTDRIRYRQCCVFALFQKHYADPSACREWRDKSRQVRTAKSGPDCLSIHAVHAKDVQKRPAENQALGCRTEIRIFGCRCIQDLGFIIALKYLIQVYFLFYVLIV